jgi:hypothetical protein
VRLNLSDRRWVNLSERQSREWYNTILEIWGRLEADLTVVFGLFSPVRRAKARKRVVASLTVAKSLRGAPLSSDLYELEILLRSMRRPEVQRIVRSYSSNKPQQPPVGAPSPR